MGLQIFNYNSKHLATFAGDLVVGNTIEAMMRLTITNQSNLCGVHKDQNNDPAFSSIPVFSKCRMVCNTESLLSCTPGNPLLITSSRRTALTIRHWFVLDVFSKIPKEQRSILPQSFPKLDSKSINCHGLLCTQFPCHMDTSFFVSPIIHFGLMPTFHYLLDFAKLVSVFRVWAAMPYTSFYFCSAVILLQRHLLVWGLKLGHFILTLMRITKVQKQRSQVYALQPIGR